METVSKQQTTIPDVSVVVLCYRAGEEIRDFVKRIHHGFLQKSISFELILVANYWPESDDRTPLIVQELTHRYSNCKAVVMPKEGMMGWDMRSGLRSATGRVIGVIDGDNQFSPESVLTVYEALIQERLDLCKTVRIAREDGLYRGLVSDVYNLIFRILFPGCTFTDINSKPKFLTRHAYEKMDLYASDWFIDAEIMIQARQLGLSVGEIPTVFRKNTRPSFVKPTAVLEFARNLLLYRIRAFKK